MHFAKEFIHVFFISQGDTLGNLVEPGSQKNISRRFEVERTGTSVLKIASANTCRRAPAILPCPPRFTTISQSLRQILLDVVVTSLQISSFKLQDTKVRDRGARLPIHRIDFFVHAVPRRHQHHRHTWPLLRPSTEVLRFLPGCGNDNFERRVDEKTRQFVSSM